MTAEYFARAYACAGDDRWIAITLPTRSDWRRLCELANLDTSSDEVMIFNWARSHDAQALMDQLQGAGIAIQELARLGMFR